MKDTLDPSWAQRFTVSYSFEERQFVKFEVYDSDGSSDDLSKHDLLGKKETTLGVLVKAQNKQFVSVLQGNSKALNETSKLYVNVDEVDGNNDLVQIQFTAAGLDNKDTFGKSDPYYVLSKSTPSGQFAVIHRSEVIKNNLSPTWKPINLTVRQICGGDFQRPLKIDIYDFDNDGDHDFIGTVKTNLEGLKLALAEQMKLPVLNPKKESKKNYKNSGTLSLKYLTFIERHSFMDYVQGGTALNFSVAVDFTASNGDPTDYRSLHFRKPPTGENQYTEAIRAVGDIISDYDVDNKFPALGFGAKLPPTFKDVHHEFFLNFENADPFCDGVQGILDAYDFAQKRIQQYGPTYFTPIIKHVANFANAYQDGKQYFILLVITDGIITDLEETKRAIVDASALPISIIIIGVGKENFAPMDVLDGDRGLLQASGKVATRDIVQFVEMRKFIKSDGSYNKQQLSQHVLAEIPNQVVEWMTMRGLKPLKC